MGKTSTERSREYRARKKQRELEQHSETLRRRGPNVRRALDASLKAMKWLRPSDDGAVAQARAVADLVDAARKEGDVARELSAHRQLTTILNELGGTPKVRMQHELRSARMKDDDEGATANGGERSSTRQSAANVAAFERPAKRRAGAAS